MTRGRWQTYRWLLQYVHSPFIQDVSTTFAAQFVNLALGMLTATIIAHRLGPGGKGMIAMASLVPSMLGIFLSGGINAANVYLIGSGRFDSSVLVGNSMGLAIPVAVFGFLVIGFGDLLGLLEKWVPGVPSELILLGMLGFPIQLLSSYFRGILQGSRQIKSLNAAALLQSVALPALTLLFVIGRNGGVFGAVWAVLTAGLAQLATLVYMLRVKKSAFIPRWDSLVLKSLLTFGFRAYLGNVLQLFNYRLDMFLVNYFLNPAGVGIYTVSVRLAELLWYLPNSVGIVIFPKAAATSPEEMNRFTPRVFGGTLGLSILGAGALVLMGKSAIRLIYSESFLSAYVPLLVLLPGVILLGSAKVLTNEIAGRGYPHYNSITSGIALGVTIICDLAFIPRYGVLGASLASSISYTLIFFVSMAFYWHVARKGSSSER